MNAVTASRVLTKSDEVAVDLGCFFDQAAADRVRFFFERFLRHSRGEWAGKPFVLLDWQWEKIIAPVFGWKAKDGSRRHRKCGCMVPKKNGKSTLLAGIGLYMLIGDNEPGAEVYSAAASREQAAIIFNEAACMVEASDALMRRLGTTRAGKRISYAGGRSTYHALSADVPTKEGLNIHCLLFDELHAQRGWDLWNALRYGGAARRQPLLFWISTAGIDREGLCYSQLEYARRILSGEIIDPDFHACVYEASEDDDWTLEATWAKANPSYGVTLSARDFQADCTEAKSSPLSENNFKRYRLNIWTRQATRWIQMHRWDTCRTYFDLEDMHRQKCWGGLDLATTTDLCALVLLFRKNGLFRMVPYFWCPEAALKNRERDNHVRLDAWVRAGHIKTTPGDVIDYGRVRKDVNDLGNLFRFYALGIDPWNATQLGTDLQDDGFKVEFVRQGFYTISAATKELEKLVLGGTIQHSGNPVMNWMIGNTAVEQDASGNVKPSKRRSMEKIDGTVALLNALTLAIHTGTNKLGKYNEKGLDSL